MEQHLKISKDTDMVEDSPNAKRNEVARGRLDRGTLDFAINLTCSGDVVRLHSSSLPRVYRKVDRTTSVIRPNTSASLAPVSYNESVIVDAGEGRRGVSLGHRPGLRSKWQLGGRSQSRGESDD